MTIEVTKKAEEVVLAIAGRLDTTTAPVLEKKIEEEMQGSTSLVLDMKGLEYVSSAGLRVLLAAQKKMKQVGKMKLVDVQECVMDVLEMTGFADILEIA